VRVPATIHIKMGGILKNIPTWAHVYHDGLNEDSSAQLQSKYVHTLNNYFALSLSTDGLLFHARYLSQPLT
jgi:hypothetical protein